MTDEMLTTSPSKAQMVAFMQGLNRLSARYRIEIMGDDVHLRPIIERVEHGYCCNSDGTFLELNTGKGELTTDARGF